MEGKNFSTNSSVELEFPVVWLQTETQQHRSRFTLISSKSKTQLSLFLSKHVRPACTVSTEGGSAPEESTKLNQLRRVTHLNRICLAEQTCFFKTVSSAFRVKTCDENSTVKLHKRLPGHGSTCTHRYRTRRCKLPGSPLKRKPSRDIPI